MKRLIRFGLVAIVVIAIGYWAFKPAAVPVDFAEVTKGPLQVTVNEEGRTRVRDRYVVSAPLPGRMKRIELEPGDPVIAGKTVVAQFQPSDPALLDVRTRAELEARGYAILERRYRTRCGEIDVIAKDGETLAFVGP